MSVAGIVCVCLMLERWLVLQVCLGLMMRRRLAGTHPASLTQRRAIEKVSCGRAATTGGGLVGWAAVAGPAPGCAARGLLAWRCSAL